MKPKFTEKQLIARAAAMEKAIGKELTDVLNATKITPREVAKILGKRVEWVTNRLTAKVPLNIFDISDILTAAGQEFKIVAVSKIKNCDGSAQ